MSAAPALIQCGDHKWAPYVIVCVHLIDGRSREWEPLPVGDDDNREIESDWLCPECAKVHDQIHEEDRSYTDEEIDNLRPVCIHCCRKIRRRFDPNYNDADDS